MVPTPHDRKVLTMSYYRLGSDTYNTYLHTYTTPRYGLIHLSPARFLRSRCAPPGDTL